MRHAHCSNISVFSRALRPIPPTLPLTVAKRQFTDEHGVVWVVWDVHPDDLGRMVYDRRTRQRAESPVRASADGPDDVASSGRSVDPELQRGWLCFQAGTEKRRFTPIPPQWEELPDSVLRVMLEVAPPAAHVEGRVPRPLVNE
jgi:hypothetical protein